MGGIIIWPPSPRGHRQPNWDSLHGILARDAKLMENQVEVSGRLTGLQWISGESGHIEHARCRSLGQPARDLGQWNNNHWAHGLRWNTMVSRDGKQIHRIFVNGGRGGSSTAALEESWVSERAPDVTATGIIPLRRHPDVVDRPGGYSKTGYCVYREANDNHGKRLRVFARYGNGCMGDSQNLIKESRNSGLGWAKDMRKTSSGELLADVSGFAKYFGIVAGVVERVIGYGILL
ncbi:hypothetical protein FA13DRAFT_1721968 [Coprinellus micaceus]|uniref:Uncharacterized protein n=1 Tax=Coprinellus micaceus TaxID=71717 RepID=A0A4Y7RV58_COPMI|nr:hypothetical protein FA13DRAFT_1721968 [Coprinellus micaceus]